MYINFVVEDPLTTLSKIAYIPVHIMLLGMCVVWYYEYSYQEENP